MMVFIMTLGLMLFGLTCMLLRKRNGKIAFSCDNVFFLVYAIYYGILFPIVYALTANGINKESYSEYILRADELDIMIYYLCHLIVIITARGVLKKGKSDILCISQDISVEKLTVEKKKDQIVKVATIFLLIGIVSSYLYYMAYGGYSNYLLHSRHIRSGVITVYNRFSFLIVFRNFTIFTTYVFFAKLLEKENVKKKLALFVLFGVSFIYALMTLYSNQGRVAFVFLFLTLLLTAIVHKKQIQYLNVKTLFELGVVFCLFMVGLFMVGDIMSRNADSNFLNLMVREISFPYYNFFRIREEDIFDIARYMFDCISWPLYLMPASIWKAKMNVTTASEIMTILASGSAKGQNGVYGESPIDLLSISYMQLGVLGVGLVIAVWLYWGCKLLKWTEENVEDKNVNLIVKVYITIYYFVYSVLYGDPYHIVQSIFPLIAFILYIEIVKVLKTKKIRIRS